MVNIADYLSWMGWFNKLNGVEARLEKTFRDLDKYYDQEIQEHLESSRSDDRQKDLLDVLLRLQSDPNQEFKLKNDDIKGVLTDMFIAGSDTSSWTLVWVMTELLKNPWVMKKAQDEVRGINVNGVCKVNETHLSEFEYLKMVVKETLRLHTPVPLLIPRETITNCNIKGFEIPAKTRVLINGGSISRDPKHWINPMEFNPDRFLNTSIDFKGQNFEFLAFGAGRRSCPGNYFALKIVELAVANFLYHFDWSLPSGMKAEDIDMAESMGITMHKKIHLCIVASSPYLSLTDKGVTDTALTISPNQ